MGFKDLFKVRQPGNGSVFEKTVKSAVSRAKAMKFPAKDNSQNSSKKSAK